MSYREIYNKVNMKNIQNLRITSRKLINKNKKTYQINIPINRKLVQIINNKQFKKQKKLTQNLYFKRPVKLFKNKKNWFKNKNSNI